MSLLCSQADDSYHIVLWPVPWNSLCVCRAGSAVVVWCVAVLRDRGLTAPGIAESIKVSACHCVFVCRLPGLVVPVGRGIELTIDRLALRDIGVRSGILAQEIFDDHDDRSRVTAVKTAKSRVHQTVATGL